MQKFGSHAQRAETKVIRRTLQSVFTRSDFVRLACEGHKTTPYTDDRVEIEIDEDSETVTVTIDRLEADDVQRQEGQ